MGTLAKVVVKSIWDSVLAVGVLAGTAIIVMEYVDRREKREEKSAK